MKYIQLLQYVILFNSVSIHKTLKLLILKMALIIYKKFMIISIIRF